MDVLRETFGEASFRGVPSWQLWATGVELSITWQGASGPSGTDTWFRLASPKLRLEQARKWNTHPQSPYFISGRGDKTS